MASLYVHPVVYFRIKPMQARLCWLSVAVHITSPVLLKHYIRIFHLPHKGANNTQSAA